MIKTILIVDDDALVGRAMYRLTKGLLENYASGSTDDVAVHLVHGNGREALKLLDEQPKLAEGMILLVTDGNMVGMDGDQLIEELQKRLGARLMPILMTGRHDEFEEASKRLGFILLHKPVPRAVFEPFVRAFIDLPVPPTS